jgi:hypothetical protein
MHTSTSFQQNLTTNFARNCVLVGQDGILRGAWQPPLFEWMHSRSEDMFW